MGLRRFSGWCLCALFAAIFLGSPALAQDDKLYLPPEPPQRTAAERSPGPFYYAYSYFYFYDFDVHFVCSTNERDELVKVAQGVLDDANDVANRARDFVTTMRQRIEAERIAGQKRRYDLDRTVLRNFETDDLENLTITYPRLAEEQVERAKATPVIDCSNPQALDDDRPPILPVDIPAIPDRVCSEAKKQTILARAIAAVSATESNFTALSDYKNRLRFRVDYYSRRDRTAAEKALGQTLEAALRAVETAADAAFDMLQKAKQAQSDAQKLTVVDCTPDGSQPPPPPPPGDESGGGQAAEPVHYQVPPRPPIPGAVAPPDQLICSEVRRNLVLGEYDKAIAAANADAATANQHLADLTRLSGEAVSRRAPYDEIKALNDEIEAYKQVANAVFARARALFDARAAIAVKPLDPCPVVDQPEEDIIGDIGGNPPPVPQPQTPATEPQQQQQQEEVGEAPPNRFIRPRLIGGDYGFEPITVGSNAKVGSGANAKKKALGMLTGMAGGFLGGGGSGGGGGGPKVARCKIKDSEQTVFSDPGSGISLKVGAKRSGDLVTVFADVDKSPDHGTFQGGWVESPDGEFSAPARADICDLWGEWSLSVSWTRTEYVNGEQVSQTSGGYQKNGSFSLPGMVSSDNAPQGLWRQLGFSNASHGARQVALTYRLPKAVFGEGPVPIFIHVTRPGLDPVVTQPFALQLVEGPKGFAIEQIDRRVFTSRAGHRLEFDDGDQRPIEPRLNDGKKVELDDDGVQVEDPKPHPPSTTGAAPNAAQ